MTTSFKKTNTFANRGLKAEKEMAKFLEGWAKGHPNKEANRLTDSKAAGRTIKAAAADFEFFILNAGLRLHGLIEVKQTEHEYRLNRDKVPQLPRLRRRSNCGGISIVAVLHSTLGRWRVLDADVLAHTGDKGSWNLSEVPSYKTLADALVETYPEAFA